VALTESWTIFVSRTSQSKADGGFVWPSWQLVAAVLGVDILASIFCLFGWVSGGKTLEKDTHGGNWTDIVTVVRVWGFSIGVVVVVAFICASECEIYPGGTTSS
jgi:H+-transporting ATPase